MGNAINYTGNSYSPDYIEKVFWVWWNSGRIPWTDLIYRIEPDDKLHKPTAMTIKGWAERGNWGERADQLDVAAREQVEAAYVNEKAKMLAKHAEIGRGLQEKGMEWLEGHEFKSAFQAIRAVELGILLERDSSNLEKLLDTVSKMDNPQIMGKVGRLLEKVNFKKDVSDIEKVLGSIEEG